MKRQPEEDEGMGILELLVVGTVIGVGYMMLKSPNRERNSFPLPKSSADSPQDGQRVRKVEKTEKIDWLDKLAYETLAKKLKRDKSELLEAVVQHDEPTLTQCAAILNEAQWAFIRGADKAHVNVRFEMTFQDGTASRTELNKHWDDIPASIRSEFLRTGNNNLSQRWVLPPP
jgi:hypothetical protein